MHSISDQYATDLLALVRSVQHNAHPLTAHSAAPYSWWLPCCCLLYPAGGFLARTDACRSTTNTNTPATCQLRLSQISVRNNTADAAGGALITNIRPEVVQLEGCSAGTFITRDTLPCLEAPNTLLKQLASSGDSSASGRSLLQTGGDAVVPLGVGGANAARSGNGNLLLTAAASVKCLLRVSAGDASDSTWLDDDCAAPISAPPGAAFGRSFVLMDGLGDPIVSGIWDASMPMGVSGGRTDFSAPYARMPVLALMPGADSCAVHSKLC